MLYFVWPRAEKSALFKNFSLLPSFNPLQIRPKDLIYADQIIHFFFIKGIWAHFLNDKDDRGLT